MRVKFYSFIFLLVSISASAQWAQTAGPAGITIKRLYDEDSVVFAGTSAKGVFRSSDHGLTWQASNVGIKNVEVFSFARDASYLYVGTDLGVYR